MSKRFTIFVSHTCHPDHGYTNQIDAVRAGWANGLDQVLGAVERGFRWTLESSIFFQAYRELRDTGRLRALAQAVHNGHIELCATYANLEYEHIDSEEMTRVCYLANRHLADELGIQARTAILSDMPGMTWSLPQVLSGSGVDYLMFWRGAYKDNMYHAKVPPIFRWKSADESEILVNLYGGPELHDFYFDKSANCFLHPNTVAERLRQIVAWHRSLGERYPFTAVHLVVGYDNGPVLTHLMDGIRWYREHVNEFEVVLATPAAFMDEIMRQSELASIPTACGDFTGAWADDPLTYADAFVAKRRAAARWNTAERLSSFLPHVRADAPRYPREELDSIQENLLLFTEHTYGSSQWGWDQFQPQSDSQRFEHSWDFSRSTWTDKRAFAVAADQISRRLLTRLSALLCADPDNRGPAVRILNPSSWARSEYQTVFVKDRSWQKSQISNLHVLHPHSGKRLPAQLTRGDHLGYEVCFRTPDVEPLGWETVLIIPSCNRNHDTCELNVSESTIENCFYKITVTPEKGVISIVDKNEDCELLCPTAEHGAGQFIYRQMKPRFHEDLYDMRGRVVAQDPTWQGYDGKRTVMGRIPEQDWLVHSSNSRVTSIRIGRRGPVVATLELESETEVNGIVARLTQEVSLYADEPLIRFRNRLRKQETLGKEEGYLGLPLSIANPVVHCEIANAIIQLGRDQLPGSFTGFTGLNRFVAISNEQLTTVVSPIGPAVVQVGGIRTHAWDEITYTPREAGLFFYVLNNLENTNAPLFQGSESWQNGFIDLDFCMTSHSGSFDPVRATRFGIRCHQELPMWVTPPLASENEDTRKVERLNLTRDQDSNDRKDESLFDKDSVPAPSHGLLSTVVDSVRRPALSGQFLDINLDPSLIVQAIKRAEDSPTGQHRGLIIRLREVAGRTAAARLNAGSTPFSSAWRCDLVENDQEQLPVQNGVVRLRVKPYGLVTVRLQ